MRSSNIIKRLLGKNETVQYKFSLSELYLKLKMIIALIMTGLILGAILFVLVYFDNLQGFSQKGVNRLLSTNSAVDFEYQDLEEPNFFGQEEASLNINILLIVIAIFGLIILPIILFYYLYYLKTSHEYLFTNQRILIKNGWLSTKAISVRYNRITDISITQSFINRLLKIGTLEISTAGSEGYEVSLSHINQPHEIKKTLYDLKEIYENYQQDLADHRNKLSESADY